ncbi:MAG: hypothetical protein AAB499_02580, partial [Patescibacteria group bacterium]
PTDGLVIVAASRLTVQPAADGLAIDLANFRISLENLLSSAQAGNIRLRTTPTKPAVETRAAEATVTALKTALKPVELIFEERKFTITVEEQYDLLDFAPENGQINWQISNEKLRGLLDRKVASIINVKMVERVVMADTNQVTTEGRDGRQVATDRLTVEVKQATTATNQQPIVVPIQTIAI